MKKYLISTVDINGCTIRVARNSSNFSRGTPLLVFNGLGLNLETLFPLMGALKETDVITFDVPGIGGSDTPVFPLTYNELARLSARLLDHFGIEKVSVLGISWGAGIALEFARRVSNRCEKLLIASGVAGMPAIPKDIASLLELSNPRRFFDKTYLRQRVGTLYGGKFSNNPGLVEAYLKILTRHKTPMTYYRLLFASCWSTSMMWLHLIKQPTLILSGREDMMLSRLNAKLLVSLIPHSKLVSLNDGHMFFYSSPEETAEKIQDFIARSE